MSEKNEPSLKKLFQNAAEIKRKEEAEKEAQELEKIRQQNEAEEKQREEYANQLNRDKIEILKKKQSGDISADNNEEKKHYTLKQKIENFFYHNKWWLGIGCFLAFTAGYLIYDAVTTKKPDMTVMLLANDDELYSSIPQMKEFLGGYCGDRNNDGEVNVSVFYMPLSEYLYNNQPEMYAASSTQLAALLQSDSPLIVIADDESSEIIENDEILFGLEKYYPDNENVKDDRFYLAKTDFPKMIGYSEELQMNDSVYIGIRKVSKGAAYENSMRENFNEDWEILKQVISDLSV